MFGQHHSLTVFATSSCSITLTTSSRISSRSQTLGPDRIPSGSVSINKREAEKKLMKPLRREKCFPLSIKIFHSIYRSRSALPRSHIRICTRQVRRSFHHSRTERRRSDDTRPSSAPFRSCRSSAELFCNETGASVFASLSAIRSEKFNKYREALANRSRRCTTTDASV